MRKKGFTLAEVLITLVIIGVIAAMTIPSLINKTNEQETVVAVKKAFTIISQAYQKIFAENGEINPSMLGDRNSEATKTLGEMFARQLNTQKVCGMDTSGDCFSTQNNGMYKDFVGNDWQVMNASNTYKMVLSDGIAVSVRGYMTYNSYGTSEALQNCFGEVIVDVNGDKGPNAQGKDVFKFRLTKFGVLPSGTQEDTDNPPENCRTAGLACTAWVITNGNMDYMTKNISW